MVFGKIARYHTPPMNPNAVDARPHPAAPAMQDAEIDVSVIVVSYNSGHLLPEMWRALKAACPKLRVEVIVVDNASRDDSALQLRTNPEFAHFKLIENTVNVGFGRANNQGVALARGRYVLLLNTDAFVSADSLDTVVAYMDQHPECGITGTRLVGRDGAPQPNCRFFPTVWNLFLLRAGLDGWWPSVQKVDPPQPDSPARSAQECDWVTGCFMMIRREVVEQTGLFDHRYFLYFEEVDFCVAAKKQGWKVIYLPTTDVIHIGGESAKSDAALTESGKQISALQIESEILYVRKHFGRSGLLFHIVLSWVVDSLRATKWLLRHRSAAGLRPIRQHAGGLWELAHRTKWGTQPTR